jgi:tribbles-like protein
MNPSQLSWMRRPAALDVWTKYSGISSPALLDGALTAGALSPDVQPNSPPTFLPQPSTSSLSLLKIGKYLLTDRLPDTSVSIAVYRAIDVATSEEFLCRVLPLDRCRTSLIPSSTVGPHPHISGISEVVIGATCAYVMHNTYIGCQEDLHAYVRRRRRLSEPEAARLFAQALEAVAHCHRNNVIVRDIKLRRFVFTDAQRTLLQLDCLYDAVIFNGSDDSLTDKHGCLAYVSPEILDAPFMGVASSSETATSTAVAVAPTAASPRCYAGCPADMWSLGVMLYTMLVGRYPFADTDACALFARIRRGRYLLPSEISLSASARCLIRSLLAINPADRLTAEETLRHPWFAEVAESLVSLSSAAALTPASSSTDDRAVPEAPMEVDTNLFV